MVFRIDPVKDYHIVLSAAAVNQSITDGVHDKNKEKKKEINSDKKIVEMDVGKSDNISNSDNHKEGEVEKEVEMEIVDEVGNESVIEVEAMLDEDSCSQRVKEIKMQVVLEIIKKFKVRSASGVDLLLMIVYYFN